MGEAFDLDKRAVRRAFERAAAHYDAHAVLQREVAARMLERFDLMTLDPRRILDAACGTGHNLGLLAKRFPKAECHGIDFAFEMVRAACAKARRGSGLSRLLPSRFAGGARSPYLASADIEHLPFARGTFDLLWSNLTLQWLPQPDAAFAEFARVLKPGSLLLFTTLGPDTLMELRAAFAELDGYAHVNRFLDMHDVGDAVVRAGFAAPVMDVEHITLTYEDVASVLRDLKAIGAHTVGGARRRGLMGKREWKALAAAYEPFRREGRLPATFEVVHGHAWAGEPRQTPGGPQTIRLDFARGRK